MNILFIRVSAIGDVIHTIPMISFIKTYNPNARISWIVQEKAAALLVGQPFLDHVWILPDNYLSPRNWSKTFSIIKQVRSHQWDAIIDFQGLLKTSLIIAPLRGKKYGFDKKNARSSLSTWFTHYHVNPTYTHIIQKNLSLVSQVISDLLPITTCPTTNQLQQTMFITIPSNSELAVQTWLQNNHINRFIAICPNTTWQSKHWPLQRWIELVALLARTKTDYQVVLIGKDFGSAAAELAQAAHQAHHSLYAIPAWDLITTAALIKKASLVIGPDTGIMHLADFLKIDTLNIFGPTLIAKHGPFWKQSNITNAIQVPCSHRYKKTHDGPNQTNLEQNCMLTLKTDMVFTKIHNILGL